MTASVGDGLSPAVRAQHSAMKASKTVSVEKRQNSLTVQKKSLPSKNVWKLKLNWWRLP